MSTFFDQLQIFSERVFKSLRFDEMVSPWHSRKFAGPEGRPTGAILHFTAGSDIRRVLRWFMYRQHNARASAHVVIADGWPSEWVPFADDLHAIRTLPAAVVQCVPPDQKAWHATWTNSYCYGIEMVNSGELRPDGEGGFTWWPDNWSRPWRAQGAVPKEPVPMFGRHWEPYTCEQILSVIEVLREVQHYHAGSVEQRMVLGHEHVVDHKRDPGPLFPIHSVRQAMFEPGVDPTTYQWFKEFAADRFYGLTWRQFVVQGWASDMRGAPVESDAAWIMLDEVLRSRFLEPAQSEGSLGISDVRRLAMLLLGYHVPWVGVVGTPEEEQQVIKTFQRMAGLTADGIPGIKTRTALVARLDNRGLLL